ncbi:hypothetical protein WJ33_27110 [Burkholderia ubonensis]|uniref:Uncharacterized protein n=1 Tax=Burkholderia ubonensis TaxID=101571 RepID=A0A103RD55_9BURK|nr:hypothetical protein WJ33_27110 [Burkholderia ubonensis]
MRALMPCHCFAIVIGKLQSFDKSPAAGLAHARGVIVWQMVSEGSKRYKLKVIVTLACKLRT